MKTYKTLETWQNAMRKDKNKKLWHDWFKIDGDWYTCEEFDDSGKYMRYTSVTAWKHIDIDTSNRYSDTWLSDMVATAYPIETLRFDVSYYIGEDITPSQIKCLAIRLKDNNDIDNMQHLVDFLANIKK